MAVPHLTNGTVLPGGFCLVQELGEGSYARVWLAEQVQTGRHYALKIARQPDFAHILRRQAKTPAHACIVGVHSLQDKEPPFYLVMDYIDGASLRDVLDECPRGLKLGAAVRLFRQVLDGLQAAHEAGVVHGDLKPENILVSRERDAKITDFGVIRTFSDASIQHSMSRHGDPAVFTPLYLAPEVRGTDEARANEGSDIYALGIILHEMLTGRPPQGADMPRRIRSSLPQWVDDVFSRTYTAVDRRFQTIADLRERMERGIRDDKRARARARAPSGAEIPVIGSVRRRRKRSSRYYEPARLPAHYGETPGVVVVGFLLSFCCPLVGIILCLAGWGEAKRRNAGEGLAAAGTVIGFFVLLVQFAMGSA